MSWPPSSGSPDGYSAWSVARAAAAELGVGLLVLDQLLWSADG
jgi:hypothetical protein